MTLHNPLIKSDNHVMLMENLYRYNLPKLPDEKEIWYYDVPKQEQFWKTPLNKDFRWLNPDGSLKNVRRMNERDRIEYIEYWRDKWLNGLWIFLEGEPVYLTGMHVDHLIFNVFKSGRNLWYLDEQRNRFYFRDLTNWHPLCDGRCWAKGRRVGITTEEITEGIRVHISDFGNNIALQSDTDTKAKSTLLKPYIDTYVRREDWMREVFYSSNGKMPQAMLELKSAQVVVDNDYPLGGWARPFPSSPKSLDGEETMLSVIDEFSKHEGVNPRETLDINIKTIVNPGKRGKIDALSTSGDSKDAVRATKDWHKLIADSNPKVLNANGKTNSGLWLWFVSYIHSLELLEKKPEIKDKFGRINKEMAEEYIWNEVNVHPKDSKPYVYALYRMPTELRHTLLTATNQGYFSKIKITARLEALRGLPNDRKPYVIGSLEYDQSGKVFFESNIERQARCEREKIRYDAGYWKIALHPYFSVEKKIDTRNRFKADKKTGVHFPPINPEFGIGYDPIRYRKEDTSSTELSDAAIVVYKKFDYYGSGELNQYAGLYLNRPDDPNDAHRECIKACKYFGAPAMHERVIESVKEEFEKANCIPFLQKSEKDGLHGLWIDPGGKIVKNSTDMMVARFAPPKNEGEVDQYEVHPFEDTLMDMDDFDMANTTAYDCYMAMVELEQGLKQIVYTNMTDNNMNSALGLLKELIPVRR